MTIILTCTIEGVEKQVEFNEDVTEIELTPRVFDFPQIRPRAFIDLTDLQSCTNMQSLNIWNFVLSSIDLSALISCTNLQSLRLSGGLWNPIDLSPLRSCKDLRELSLIGHYFKHIDLSPLKACVSLQTLKLSKDIRNINLDPISSLVNLQTVSLEGQFESISLESLGSCVHLRHLNMNGLLRTLDLSPLHRCTELQVLDLGNNRLRDLDLKPLHSCTRLRELHLKSIGLENLDLTPLETCASLRLIDLEQNGLVSLDLSPLCSCPRLVKLYLHNNRNLEELDITPLQFLQGLEELRFHRTQSSKLTAWVKWVFPIDQSNGEFFFPFILRWASDQNRISGSDDITLSPPAPEDSWELLYKISWIPKSYSIPVQDYIQRALRLNNFGFIDSDMSGILHSIPPYTSLDVARGILLPQLTERIGEQIERGGTTIGLKVDDFWNIREIATKVKEIYELRDAEMKQITIFRFVSDYWSKHVGRYDMSELSLTAYGFDILSNLGLLKRQIMDKHFDKIKKTLNEIGYEMEVVEVDEPKDVPEPKNKVWMSDAMMNYILALSVHSFQYSRF